MENKLVGGRADNETIKDIAKKAVEVLIQQINQRSATIEHIVLKTALVERESVK